MRPATQAGCKQTGNPAGERASAGVWWLGRQLNGWTGLLVGLYICGPKALTPEGGGARIIDRDHCGPLQCTERGCMTLWRLRSGGDRGTSPRGCPLGCGVYLSVLLLPIEALGGLVFDVEALNELRLALLRHLQRRLETVMHLRQPLGLITTHRKGREGDAVGPSEPQWIV